MQTDYYLVIGLVLGALAFPSLLNAFSEGRFPRLALLLFLAASVLVILAVTGKPGGYNVSDIPQAFVRVFGRLIN